MYRFLLCILSLYVLSLDGFQTITEAERSIQFHAAGQKQPFAKFHFSALLKEIVQTRENLGYTGRYIIKLTPYPETTFVIWGPLKGAFSSLVRSLRALEQRGIITNDFKIAKEATYFVFNGDVINDQETSLETLSVVLSLMKANPHRIFYIKGNAEDALHWQNDGLKRALQEKIPPTQNEKIPLGITMTRFFDTLPLALFITGQDPDQGSVRISYFPRTFKEIDEIRCGKILTSKKINVPQVCYLARPQNKNAQVKALIKSEQRLMSYRHHPGLMIVEPDKGSVAWSIFSGPNTLYQDEYQFFLDSFVILTMGATIEDATLALYNTDIRTSEPMQHKKTFNLLTGMHVSQGVPKAPQHLERSTIQADIGTLTQELNDVLGQVVDVSQQLSSIKKQGVPS